MIDREEVINEQLSLLDREAEKLSERKTIGKVITPNIPRVREKGHILKEGNKAKTLKAVKTILKTTKKAHGNDKEEEVPSNRKKLKEPVPNPTDTTK